MSYDEDWLVKENIIDEKLSRNPKEHVIEDTSLQGIGIKDAIILYNWLYYAKKLVIKITKLYLVTQIIQII